MRRPTVPTRYLPVVLVAVAVLAVASPALAATVQDGPEASLLEPGNDTVSQLRLPSTEPVSSDRHVASSDLSGVLSAEEERLAATLSDQAFERDFEAATDPQDRMAIVESEIQQLESRAATLQTQRQDAVKAYARGDLSAKGLFREFVRIETAATGVRERIERVRTIVDGSAETTLPSELTVRLTSIEGDLVTLEGALTGRISTAVYGESSSRTVHVEATGDGVALAAIDGEQFLREATVWSARADSGLDWFADGDALPPSAAYQRAVELYPWASSNQVSNPSIDGIGDSSIYAVSLSHYHGELTTYLDGRTTDVFHEIQRLRLLRLPTDTIATNSTESLSMRINGTFDGGPMAISVTDSTDGPVDAAIRVDNGTVGTTGTDGQLWIIDTSDGQNVTARTPDGNTVSATIDR